MAKKEKEIEQLAPKGNRITGRKASAERYIPLFEFLMFDPLYRDMNPNAKILYCYLREKTKDWEKKTESFEAGEEGFTKSYRDDQGKIYLLADNAELSVILQCNHKRVKDQKDVLKRYGLLEEVPRHNENGKRQTSFLYVLDPKEEYMAERWAYIDEINKLREEIKLENKAKAEKRKTTKKVAKKVDGNKDSDTNPQNAGWSNSQNAGWTNPQNVAQNHLEGFKSTLEDVKYTTEQEQEQKEWITDEEIDEILKESIKEKVLVQVQDLSNEYFQIDSKIALEIFRGLRTGKWDLPEPLINNLVVEIKKSNTFRDDFVLDEVEKLYLKYKPIIVEHDEAEDDPTVISEYDFTQMVMSLYINGEPIKRNFARLLLSWFNNKFEFKEIDMEKGKVVSKNDRQVAREIPEKTKQKNVVDPYSSYPKKDFSKYTKLRGEQPQEEIKDPQVEEDLVLSNVKFKAKFNPGALTAEERFLADLHGIEIINVGDDYDDVPF